MSLPSRIRRSIATVGVLGVTATGLALVPYAAPAHAATITLSPTEVGEALFVAGDAARLSEDPLDSVLERVMQKMFELRPDADPDAVVAELRALEGDIVAGAPTQGAGEIAPQTLFRIDYLKCTLYDPRSQPRDELCEELGNSEALHQARAEAAARAARKAARSAELKRALAKLAEEAALVASSQNTGLGTFAMDPLHERLPASYDPLYDPESVLRDSYELGGDNVQFRTARDKYWSPETGQSLKQANQDRLSDPDLAALTSMTAKMALDGSIALTTDEAEKAADDALNGPRGGSEATAWALAQFDALEAAQKLKDKAVTDAEKKAADDAFKQAQKDMEQPLRQAKEFVDGAKTVVKFANFFIEKFDKATAESIKETADVVFNVAESVIGIGGAIVSGIANFYSGNWIGLIGNAFTALSGLESLFSGESTAPKPDPVKDALAKLAENLEALQNTMNERFDRIDEALNQIYSTMTQGMTEIIERIETNNNNVLAVFDNLQAGRAELVRLEATVFTLFADEQRRALNLKVSQAIGKDSMTQAVYDDAAPFFANWALTNAKDSIALGGQRSFADERLAEELDKGLAVNADFLREYPQRRWGMAPLTQSKIPNPNEWAYAARAYQRLMLEHPQHFRSESRNARWLNELIDAGERLREALNAPAELNARDASGPVGTGNRVLNRALDNLEVRWDVLNQGVTRITDTYEADLSPRFAIHGGATQTPDMTQRPTVPASTCGTVPGKVPAGVWARGIPNAAGMAVLTNTVSVRVCIDAEWVDRRTVVTRAGSRITTTYRGKLRTTARIELLDTAGEGVGTIRARGTGVRTGSEVAICRDTETVMPGNPDPGDFWTDCDDRTEAPAVADRDWASVGAHTYAWSSLTPANDTDLQRDVNAELRTHLGRAYSYVTNALRPYRTVVVGGTTYPLPHGAELMTEVNNFNAARELLANYVELGLPQQLAADSELRMLLRGAVVAGEPGVNPFFALTEGLGRLPDQHEDGRDDLGHLARVYSLAEHVAPGGEARALVHRTVTDRIDQTRAALRRHVTDTTPGSLSSMIVDSTLTGLLLTQEALQGGGPVARVTSGPSGKTTAARPTMAFTAGEQATYQCRIVPVGGTAPGFGACSSATAHTPAKALSNGEWRFEVRAQDRSRNPGPVASRTFTVTGSTPAALKTFKRLKKPKIKGKGKAKVGKRLRATKGKWTPAPKRVRYQWFRGKRAIKGATKKAYRLTRKDARKKITVRITVQRPGYRTAKVKAKAVRVR